MHTHTLRTFVHTRTFVAVYLRFFTVKRLNTSKRETAHLPLISFRKTLWNTPEIKCAFRQVKNLHEPRGSFTLLCFSGFSSCMIKPLSGIQHCWRFIYLYTEYLNFIEKWSTRVIMRHQPIRRFSRNIPEISCAFQNSGKKLKARTTAISLLCLSRSISRS